MLDIIKSYISNEKFYIIIMDSAIYIKNYSKIINIADDEIIIEISGTLYKIKGSSFSLTKSINRELEIKGYVESVDKL